MTYFAKRFLVIRSPSSSKVPVIFLMYLNVMFLNVDLPFGAKSMAQVGSLTRKLSLAVADFMYRTRSSLTSQPISTHFKGLSSSL